MKRLIAGWGQYIAYQKIHNTTINTLTAGAINVQFGISLTLSISLVTINTLISDIKFHVIKANTPFLLYLANMDTL